MLEVATRSEVAVRKGGLADSSINKGAISWMNPLVTLLIESRPIGNTGVEKANVNIVEMVCRMYPFAAGIVGLKAEIGGLRHALDRREIGPYQLH